MEGAEVHRLVKKKKKKKKKKKNRRDRDGGPAPSLARRAQRAPGGPAGRASPSVRRNGGPPGWLKLAGRGIWYGWACSPCAMRYVRRPGQTAWRRASQAGGPCGNVSARRVSMCSIQRPRYILWRFCRSSLARQSPCSGSPYCWQASTMLRASCGWSPCRSSLISRDGSS